MSTTPPPVTEGAIVFPDGSIWERGGNGGGGAMVGIFDDVPRPADCAAIW